MKTIIRAALSAALALAMLCGCAALAEGEKVSGRTLEFGPVTSVIRGAAGTDFQVGSLGIFKYDDIKQIL